jgi:large subunit ribosomal protein L22
METKTETANLIKSSFVNAPLTPRKMRTVVNYIRGRKVDAAVEYLEFSNLKSARILSKVVKSAIANAKNLKITDNNSDLVIERVDLGKGRAVRKGRPGIRGAMIPIRKIYSTVSVYLKKIENEQKS